MGCPRSVGLWADLRNEIGPCFVLTVNHPAYRLVIHAEPVGKLSN